MTSGLSVTDLEVAYRRRPPTLREVNFVARRGEMTALIGANGSGKSTLLHALLGLVPKAKGSILFDGFPLALQQRWSVGFCADDLPLPELLTGGEFVRLMASIRDVKISESQVSALFGQLNMTGADERLVKEYSHGMKRKLQLLVNVVHSPELLVLDEPFRGLDTESHQLVLELLGSFVQRDAVVVLSTHDLYLAESICQRALVVDDTCVQERVIDAHRIRQSESSPTRSPRFFLDILDGLVKV